ncbi:MAG: TIGR02449 family protein [Gammaproteobacteria bacterium]|nr:TIGR02449 family protein [Gammaproteobacteria bacterium]
MDNPLPKALESELAGLEKVVHRLGKELENLREEKRLLSERLNSVNSERAQLLNKNAIVQSRVEAMITRLKGIEQA